MAERSAAAVVTWDLTTGAPLAQRGCGNSPTNANDCGVTDGTDGNIRTFTNGTNILKAAAFSTTDDAGTSNFVKSWLGIYSSGLGVTNPFEAASSPNHTVDNNGKNDLVVFQLPTTGWVPLSTFLTAYGDTDIRAWVGGNSIADLTSPTWTTLNYNNLTTNGFTAYTATGADLAGGTSDRTANLNKDPNGTGTPPPPANLTGKFLIIAADIASTSTNDAFKIKNLSGQTPSTVPEPVTSVLLGVSLVALGLLKRRMA